MAPVKRAYAGETAAERAARRRRELVDAAFDLVAADGAATLRIERICAQAGLNKRYFYESFAGVDAVVVAVMDQLAEDAIAATLAPLGADLALPEFVRTGVGALLGHLVADPRRARVLFGETALSAAAARHRAAAIHRIVAVATAQGRALNQLGDDPEPIAELAGAMVVGGTRQAVLEFLDGELHADVDALADDLAELWLAVSEVTATRARRRGRTPRRA